MLLARGRPVYGTGGPGQTTDPAEHRPAEGQVQDANRPQVRVLSLGGDKGRQEVETKGEPFQAQDDDGRCSIEKVHGASLSSGALIIRTLSSVRYYNA